MFSSFHSYYSRLVGGNWYRIRYLADPEIYNSPKITKFTEETSEFHKYNISNYPEHKKTMDLWLSISANRHIEFEKMIAFILIWIGVAIFIYDVIKKKFT